MNETLHRTQEELQEVKLCQNQTRKKLGEVQREESLEAALLETRKELAATKALHQQEIDELRAAQDLSEIRQDLRRLEDDNQTHPTHQESDAFHLRDFHPLWLSFPGSFG